MMKTGSIRSSGLVKRLGFHAGISLVLLLSACTVGAAEFAPYPAPNEDTVLLLHLNETSGTTVMNDNHANFDDVGDATISNAPARGVSSVTDGFGTAYGVDASNFVELRYYPSSGPATSDWYPLCGDETNYTFEAWVKWDPATSGAGRQALASANLLQGDTATGLKWNLSLVPIDANTARLNLTAYNTGQLNSDDVSWDPDLWYHVAFTKTYTAGGEHNYGLADFNFYITPENAAEFPVNVGTFAGENDFRVPQSSGSGGTANLRFWIGAGSIGAFSGQIDEVRVSNAVLTDFPLLAAASGTTILVR
jgi:hypothetical protein